MMTIIPAIDIIDGRCVRLSQGDYSRCKAYCDDPLEVALRYEDAGFSRLHLVDLDGAKASSVVNCDVLERICAGTSLKVDFGGGVKSDADIRRVFDSGARMACIGSVAYTDPALVGRWLARYGGDRIIIGADVKDGMVCTHGWKNVTDTTIFGLADIYKGRMKYLMCTDISRDGMLSGTAVELYASLMERYPDVRMIASGGVGGTGDIDELKDAGVCEVIVGKAIYEGKISLEELRRYEK